MPTLNQVGRVSYRNLVEYDCSAHRSRVIRAESYLTHMASGTARDVDEKSSEEAEWFVHYPGSRADKMSKLVCAK